MDLRTFLASGAMTQTELAKAVGVTQPMVSQWARGLVRVAADRVVAIERATGGRVTRQELRPDLY